MSTYGPESSSSASALQSETARKEKQLDENSQGSSFLIAAGIAGGILAAVLVVALVVARSRHRAMGASVSLATTSGSAAAI